MNADETLNALLRARANMRDSQWWGRLEPEEVELLGVGIVTRNLKYEGVLAGRNDISDVIEGFLANLAEKSIDAKDAESNRDWARVNQLNMHIAEYVIRFMTETVQPYALGEQRDLVEAGNFVEMEEV